MKTVMKTAHKKATDQYAIFQTGGKQYQAIPGKTVAIEKIDGEAGSKLTFDTVVFKKSGTDTFEFGKPFIKDSKITANIVKQDKGPKVIVFKFQRRKKRRTKTGHRQPLTVVRIESI
jgi:large subunit ribosomal protein L21